MLPTFKVLVVDDDHNAYSERLRESLKDELQPHKPDDPDKPEARAAELKIEFAGTFRGGGDENQEADAQTCLNLGFYHLVLCDYMLDESGGGDEVLDHAAKFRPSARRVLMTTKFSEAEKNPEGESYGSAVARQIVAARDQLQQVRNMLELFRSPTDKLQIAQSFLVRNPTNIGSAISGVFTDWRKSILEISVVEKGRNGGTERKVPFGESPLLHEIVRKCERKLNETGGPHRRKVDLVEVGEALYRLFRRSHSAERAGRAFDAIGDDVARLELKSLQGGRSSATVIECIPYTRDGRPGNRCVIKISPMEGFRAELSGFERYVKHYRSDQRRVELLGHVELDTLGVMCYSFAGGSSKSVDPLESFVSNFDLRAIDYLEGNYHPSRREWYRQLRPLPLAHNARSFFEHAHLNPKQKGWTDVGLAWHDNVLELARGNTTRLSDEILISLRPPNETEYASIEVLPNITCIVHGDMNFGNLLVADAPPLPKRFTDRIERDEWWNARQAFFKYERSAINRLEKSDKPYDGPASALNYRLILIDYQFTTRGPVFLDFAALECTMRIQPQCTNYDDVGEILRQGDIESDIWHAAWHEGGPSDYVTDKSRWESWGYWGVFSYELIKMARRNFQETQEYDRKSEPNRPVLGLNTWERLYAATCLLYLLRYYLIKDFGISDIPSVANPGEFVDRKGQYALRLGLWMRHLLKVINTTP